jgi:hypothetical protein
METKRKFPDLEWPIATGGFFFLRYICPAIVAPETIMPEFASRTRLPFAFVTSRSEFPHCSNV